ncbi:hypothetical protein Nmel_012469 [Mimus melanotis]
MESQSYLHAKNIIHRDMKSNSILPESWFSAGRVGFILNVQLSVGAAIAVLNRFRCINTNGQSLLMSWQGLPQHICASLPHLG